MVTGFVAVNVSAQQALFLDVLVVLVVLLVQRFCEEVVEAFDELLVASEARYHALHVVWNMEGIVGAVTLDEAFAVGLDLL